VRGVGEDVQQSANAQGVVYLSQGVLGALFVFGRSSSSTVMAGCRLWLFQRSELSDTRSLIAGCRIRTGRCDSAP
jgi:hypothetical protein